jgi:hypothetical protein
MQRRAKVGTAVAAAATVVVLAGCVSTDDRAAPVAEPSASPTRGESSPTVSDGPSAAPRSPCDEDAQVVEPQAITVPGAIGRAAVVTPPRDANGVPGVPPLTAEGKSVFAWDREQGIRPGDPRGNVLLNAHTWPDGSALGNRLLEGLQEGDRVVVHGPVTRLCYRVTERVEVVAADGMPRYYATKGPHQLAIIVCSGRRLAPGVWEKRTVWFAARET